MVLNYSMVGPNYQIKETHSFHGGHTMIVLYSADLTKKKVDDDPWRETTEIDRRWFRKYYSKHFKEALKCKEQDCH